MDVSKNSDYLERMSKRLFEVYDGDSHYTIIENTS